MIHRGAMECGPPGLEGSNLYWRDVVHGAIQHPPVPWAAVNLLTCGGREGGQRQISQSLGLAKMALRAADHTHPHTPSLGSECGDQLSARNPYSDTTPHRV